MQQPDKDASVTSPFGPAVFAESKFQPPKLPS